MSMLQSQVSGFRFSLEAKTYQDTLSAMKAVLAKGKPVFQPLSGTKAKL